MKNSIVSLIALGASVCAASNIQAATISGTVKDAETRIKLEGVRVTLDGTDFSTTTDRTGDYQLTGIPAGTYTLRFDYIGAQTSTTSVTLSEDEVAIRNLGLEDQVYDLEAFVVDAEDIGQARALNAQRAASSLKTIVASDAVGLFPDQNVAESLQRLPGITIEKDQGEGRYVAIRGIDPDLSNISIDGVLLSAPEGESRAVALDVVPTDIIDMLEVSKVTTPDMDGDSIGGNINIRTKSAFDRSEGAVSLSAEGYYNDLVEELSGRASATYSEIFNNDTVGLTLSVTYETRDLGSDNAEVDGAWEEETAEDGSEDFFAPEIEFRNYIITRERYSFASTLEFKPADNAYYALRANYNYFSDDEQRYRWELKNEDSEIASIGDGTATLTATEDTESDRDIKDRFEEQEIWVLAFEGTKYLDAWTIDYQIAFTHGEENEPNRLDTDFRLKDQPYDYSYAFDREGGYVPTITHISGANIYDPANYEFNDATLENNISEEEEFSAKVDLRYDMDTANPSFIQFGLKFRDKEKKQDVTVDIYEWEGADDYTLASVSEVDDRFPFGNNPGGGYLRANAGEVRSFFDSNLGSFEKDEDGSLEDSSLDDYVSTEEILAAYFMGGITIGDIQIVGGVRVEETDFVTTGNNVTFDADGDIDTVVPISSGKDYTDVLPSISLRYDMNERTIIRASVSTNIARPKFGNSALRQETNIEDEEVSIGNPDLDPYEAINFDLSAEYYNDQFGVISVALFHKDIDNFIFSKEIDDGFVFDDGTTFDLETYENGDSAKITGIEINYQQDLVAYSEALDGLSVYLNATLTDSEADIGRDEDVPFLKQSDLSYSAGIQYANGPFSIRLVGTFRNEYLDSVGGDKEEDEYIDDNFQWDISTSYQVNDTVQVFVDIININNEPKNTYYDVSNRPRQYEEYSWAARFGVKAHF